ncbi:MAG: hypothetical protein ACHQ4J_16400 [Candidatus Binatia bacterium]
MTRDGIAVFFDRRQAAYDSQDAASLAAGYTVDCLIESRRAASITVEQPPKRYSGPSSTL